MSPKYIGDIIILTKAKERSSHLNDLHIAGNYSDFPRIELNTLLSSISGLSIKLSVLHAT